MKSDDLDFFRKWFNGYTEPFRADYSDIKFNIDRKFCHTKRVCAVMRKLCKDMDLDGQKSLMAETIALFHDIGRFEQLKKYKTYFDKDSVNHAELGVSILKEHDVLDRLSESEQELICTAISLHNVRTLPEDLAGDELFFTKLIRDADKLDIIHLELDYFRSRDEYKDPAMEMGLPDTGNYSKGSIAAILNHECIDYNSMSTYSDFKLVLLSWVFRFNFTPSLRYFDSKGYLSQIFDFLPESDDIKEVRGKLETFITKRLETDA